MSMTLSLVMLFYVIPTVVYAEIADAFSKENGADHSTSGKDNDTLSQNGNNAFDVNYPLYELTELRSENVKHFRLSDGSYIAAQYTSDVHYLDESGIWQDIDNTLSLDGDELVTADSRIKLAKKINGSGKLLSLKNESYSIDLSVIGAERGSIGIVAENGDSNYETELQKMLNLEKLSSKVTYPEIFSGADMELSVFSYRIEEKINVTRSADKYSYSFELKLKGLVAEVSDDGSIVLSDSESKALVYVLSVPTVIDASGKRAPRDAAAYTLSGSGEKYYLTLTLDRAWMNDTSRAYPVSVSPFYTSKDSDTEIGYETGALEIDGVNVTYVKINDLPSVPDGSYVSEVLLNLSKETPGGPYGLYEVTSDWSADSLSYESYLSGEGKISESITDSTTEGYVFNVTELVDKWRNDPESNHGVAIMPLDTKTNGSRAATLAYSARSATVPTVSAVYSTTEGLEDYLSYTSQSFVKAGTSSINNATGHLNLSIPLISTTDNFMPTNATLVYNSYFADSYHVYPYADTAYSTVFLPKGFKLNVCESIVKKEYASANSGNVVYYLYEDADGTAHAFFETSTPGVYVDNDGLQMKMTVGASSITITDDSKKTRTFIPTAITGLSSSDSVKAGWILANIRDSFGNTVNVNSINGRVDNISLQPNGMSETETLSFYYKSDGMLYCIYGVTSRKFVFLRYDQNNRLSSIEFGYLDNQNHFEDVEQIYYDQYYTSPYVSVQRTVNYVYDTEGRITRICDISEQELLYTWDSADRVVAVKHVSTSGEGLQEGKEISLTYGVGYTDVKTVGNDEVLGTEDDMTTRYVFDDRGRATSAYSFFEAYKEIYNATKGVYYTEQNTANKLKEQFSIGGTAVNYLLNGDFEIKSGSALADFWTTTGSVSRSKGDVDDSYGEYYLYAKPRLNAPVSISQNVHLSEGEYTFTMPYSSFYTIDVKAYMKVYSITDNSIIHSEEIPITEKSIGGALEIFSTTFSVTGSSSGKTVLIAIEFSANSSDAASASIGIDNVSLTKGVGSSEYSYLKYGSFDNSGRTSQNLVSASVSTYWKTENSGVPTVTEAESPFGNAVKITAGGASSTKYVKQRVFEANPNDLHNFQYDPSSYYSNVKKEYIISGFGKATDAVSSGIFGLRADVLYYQGEGLSDVVVTYQFDFVPTSDGWQFTTGYINGTYTPSQNDTNKYGCIRAIDIYCEYSNQASGYALFDEISVVGAQGSNIERYYYYENGLLSRVEDFYNKSYYFYDSDRNLIKTANNQGTFTDYEYTAEGVVSSAVEYDFEYYTDFYTNYDYPYYLENHSNAVTKNVRSKTVYTYNSFGMCVKSESFEAEENNSGQIVKKADTNSAISTYVYNTTEIGIFGNLTEMTDTTGVTEKYFYDSTSGLRIATINVNEQSGLIHEYDDEGNLRFVYPAVYQSDGYSVNNNGTRVAYTYNSNGLLTGIQSGITGTVYKFTYDAFGNSSATKVGNTTLASYEYNENNGKIKKINYGNGFSVEYVYNRLEMLSEIWYNENGTRTLAYSYEYTDDGQVYEYHDHKSGYVYVNKYDRSNRLVSSLRYDENDYKYELSKKLLYDSNNRINAIHYYLKCASSSGIFNYHWYYVTHYVNGGLLSSVSLTAGSTRISEDFGYDGYGRLTETNYGMVGNNGVFYNDVYYQYDVKYNDGEYTATGLVSEYISVVNQTEAHSFNYEYDDENRIVLMWTSDGDDYVEYEYDKIGQLVSVKDTILDRYYEYTYDVSGNVLTKKIYSFSNDQIGSLLSTDNYTYANSEWKDLLTSYKGVTITYDGIGNPLSYYNGTSYTFTWSGRQLESAIKNGAIYSFEYDESGYRTKKSYNGTTTTYYYDGDQLIAEETNGNVTVYLYNSSGEPIGMQYREANTSSSTWQTYWYERNLYGDIIAVYSEAGVKLVSYTYDAWGNTTVAYHNGGASTRASSNPFTYRGYYYDSHLGLYYLGTRYYDSNTCRFINADSMMSGVSGSLEGYNLFAYCFNDPINFSDSEGEWPKWGKKLAKAAKVVAEFTVKVVVAAAESFEVQVGLGFGTTQMLAGGVEVETSRDTYVGLDDGKLTTGTRFNTTLSHGQKSISVSCDYLSEKGGETVALPESDSFIDALTNSDSEYTAELTFSKISVNSKGDILFGWQRSAYLGGGGYYSVKFNISEFVVRLFE